MKSEYSLAKSLLSSLITVSPREKRGAPGASYTKAIRKDGWRLEILYRVSSRELTTR